MNSNHFARVTARVLLSLMLCASLSFAATNPLNNPQGLALDAKGNLYVANNGSNQILIYNTTYVQPTAKTISTNVNQPTGVAINGIDNPYAIATDAIGDIWVENNFSSVTVYPNLVMDPPFRLKTFSLSNPVTGLAAHDLWIAFGGNTSSLVVETGPWLAGVNYRGISISSSAYSLAYDAAGNLYTGSIQKALNVTNARTGVTATLVQLTYFPWGMAVDIYISDADHNMINVYNTKTGKLLHTIQ